MIPLNLLMTAPLIENELIRLYLANKICSLSNNIFQRNTFLFKIINSTDFQHFFNLNSSCSNFLNQQFTNQKPVKCFNSK